MPVYDDEKTKPAQHLDDEGAEPLSPDEQASLDQAEAGYDESAADPHDLRAGEEQADTPQASDAEKVEKSKVSDDAEEPAWKTNVQRARSNVSVAKKVGIAGGIIGVMAIGIVALISFLLPFKLTNIIENIEQRVGQVPQYAVEQRLEFYMSRYLMIRSLEATGEYDFSPGGADRDRFTYLGSGFWDTMYTNWKGAKLEEKLVSSYGVKVNPVVNDRSLILRDGKLRAHEFYLEHTGTGRTSSLHNQPLDRGEVRQLIREFSKAETKSSQVFKRYHMRKVMKNYFGVGNWKPFEKARDNIENKYLAKKRAFKTRLVNETVGRVSERYSKYMECLLNSANTRECRDVLKRADPENARPPNGSEDDGTNDVGDDLESNPDLEGDSEDNRRLARRVMDKLQDFGIKKFLTSLVTGVGIIANLTHIYDTVDSGVINQVIYDKNAQQYAAFAAPFLSANDQSRAGENNFDVEDVRVAHEVLNNYNTSPVYTSGVSSGGTVSAAGQVYRDCNDNSADGDETLLAAGETVCPHKRLVQNKTAFTENQGWQVLGNVLAPFRGVNSVLERFGGILSSVLGALGVTDAISSLVNLFGLDDVAARAMGFLFNLLAGPVISGAETAGDAFDALYAGISVILSAVGGEAGVAKEDTIGGAYLSGPQVTAIRESQLNDYYHELEQKPFFARYFSPSVKESISGQLAMQLPSTVPAAGQQAVSSLASFGNIFSSLGNLFSSRRVSAQNMAESNPFHVINMGFPVNHEIFTANNGEGMDPDEIQTRYQCSLPADQRPQNQQFGRPDGLPFDVPIEEDPCLLEQAVLDASTRYFTGNYDEGIDGATSTTSTGSISPTGIVGDPFSPSDSVPCAAGTQDLGIHDGYNDGALIKLRLCAVPNIASSSSESTPGSSYYVQGADGKAIVSSRVSGAVFAMADAAMTAGVTLSANSSFRTMAHQQALWNANPNPTYVAPPGQSNHQTGVAIDFRAGSVKGGATCDLRAGAPGIQMWDWLFTNAERFGYKQYSAESWHWDPSPSASRCDSSQPARIIINSRAPL